MHMKMEHAIFCKIFLKFNFFFFLWWYKCKKRKSILKYTTLVKTNFPIIIVRITENTMQSTIYYYFLFSSL